MIIELFFWLHKDTETFSRIQDNNDVTALTNIPWQSYKWLTYSSINGVWVERHMKTRYTPESFREGVRENSGYCFQSPLNFSHTSLLFFLEHNVISKHNIF